MIKKQEIFDLLNLKQGDIAVVRPFMLYSFFMGGAVAIFYTATMSLFLDSFDRTMLPKSYIVSGIIVYVLGYAVSKFQKRVYFSKISLSLILFLIASVIILLIVHFVTGNKWVYFFLFIWNRVFVFVNGLSFWAIVSRIFNHEQARRLISFITTGDVVSSILSYLSVPLLLRFTTTHGLLYVSLGALMICVVLSILISKKYNSELSVVAHSHEGREDKNWKYFFKTPYYTAIFLLAILPVFGLFYVEYVFAIESKSVFPDKELLAGFLGVFFSMCAEIELFIKFFLYGRIIEKYGLKLGLVILPLSLTVFFAFAAMYGSFYGATYVFFAFIVMSRFFMSALRKSISEPSFQLLFQPIEPVERLELQSRIEGGPKAIGSILAGVFLLALTYFTFIDTIYLSYIFLFILVGWVWIALTTQTLYRNTLRNVLAGTNTFLKKRRRQVEDELLPTVEEVVLEMPVKRLDFESIIKMAQSKDPDERLQAVYLLGKSGRYFAFKYLEELLHDKNHHVKRAAILASGSVRKNELWPHLFNSLSSKYYKQPVVLALAEIGEPVIPDLERFFNRLENDRASQLKIICVIECINSNASIKFLRAKMNHPDPHIRDRVYEALKKLHYRATVLERPHITAEIDEKAALMVWLMAAQKDLTGQPETEQLVEALEEESYQTTPKLFNLLAILNGDQGFDLIKEMYENKSPETRGFLQEIFNMALTEDMRVKLMPLFDDLPLSDKLQKCQENYPQQHLSVEDRIVDIVNKDFSQISSSLKAVGIQNLLDFPESEYEYLLVACANSGVEIIAETALYVLKKLYPDALADFKEIAQFREVTQEIEYCHTIENSVDGEELLVNKLKSVRKIELLAKLPPDSLIPVAATLRSFRLNQGDVVEMNSYCVDGIPFLIVSYGTIELIETDGTTHPVGEWDYWYHAPEPPPTTKLESVRALSNAEIILLDPYLIYNLIADIFSHREERALAA
ncbi:hypothetical protein [Runella sp.]|uniref:HEAT repeat domain-containing protein n=1 Tax=Runella sp. TaxID=1960881 RepID=UPI00301622B3